MMVILQKKFHRLGGLLLYNISEPVKNILSFLCTYRTTQYFQQKKYHRCYFGSICDGIPLLRMQ